MLADTIHDERRGIEEHYTSSTSTSDLRIEAERRKPADMLVAAGWSHSRVGAALLRLHSEFDGAEKPQRATPEALELLASTFQREPNGLVKWKAKGEGGRGELVKELKPLEAARRQAHAWYLHELGLLLQKLKTLVEVRTQLIRWCGRVGMSGGQHKVAEVLSWWLDPTCRVCDGRKWELIEGTARHSGKACRECRGSGEADLPHGHEGKKMLRHINDCLQAARSSMSGRFQHQHLAGAGNQLPKN